MKTLEKRIAPREILSATAQLRDLEGNARPYFSVTGEIRDTRRRGDNAIVAIGCLPEISEHFPQLRPLIALHLADDYGVPMHAVENGLYHLGLTRYPDGRNLEHFAKLWRIDAATAEKIDAYVSSDPNPREALTALIRAEYAEKWQHEADAGIALLESL